MARKIMHAAVIIVALVICLLLIWHIPAHLSSFTTTLLGPPTTETPRWGDYFLHAIFFYFVFTVLFPFFLTIGWVFCSPKRKGQTDTLPFISVIIPAFNEERSIQRSLNALKKIDYPSFEVIVINDGSTDFTFSIIETASVKCIQLHKNRGKAAALNAGIAASIGDIIVFSDSDSWLHPMALRHLANGFTSSQIGAVSGSVEIKPQNNLLRHWQALEYTFGQFLIKEAQLGSGSSVAICPGPVAAYRKDLLMVTGGFSSRTITEDFDATLEIIRAGYQVTYTPEALAYTEAPASWRELRQQRLRWFRGHLQTFRFHHRLFFSKNAGGLGFYWLPVYYLFFGYFCGTIELIVIPLIVTLLLILPNSASLLLMTVLYNLLALVFVGSGYSFVLLYSRRFTWSLLGSAFLCYPYLFYLNWLRVRAIMNEVRGKVATWKG